MFMDDASQAVNSPFPDYALAVPANKGFRSMLSAILAHGFKYFSTYM